MVGCAADGAAWVRRIEEVREVLGVRSLIAVALIGDATTASRGLDTEAALPDLYFARGPFVVRVQFSAMDQGAAEDVARALDVVLAATP
jgi:hypothetical protein